MASMVASGKLLVHGKFSSGKLHGSNPGDGGKRRHFRARPRRRVGAVDQEDRNRRSPRQIEKRVTACERIETAGDKAHRGEAGAGRAHHVELLAQTLAVEERGIRMDVAGAHVPHDEPVDVRAINERPEPGTIDEAAEPTEKRPMSAHHGGQRSALGRRDQNEPRRRRRRACGMSACPHLSPGRDGHGFRSYTSG
jgi:hypothetical protein